LSSLISKKIRASARGQQCTLRCGLPCAPADTVVFAHLPSRWKGMGVKSPDLFGVYSCMSCHVLLDSGKVSAADKLRALQETQMKLYQQGLIEVAP